VTNALKRSRAQASGRSVEARSDAAIDTLEVQWGEESERPWYRSPAKGKEIGRERMREQNSSEGRERRRSDATEGSMGQSEI
jgi:hypothetical protein